MCILVKLVFIVLWKLDRLANIRGISNRISITIEYILYTNVL